MLNRLIKEIDKLILRKRYVIIAIDGRCASGKTTLAEKLQNIFGCNVIHADDFFLQPHQRTAERLNTAGGNIDSERLIREVLVPLSKQTDFSYLPYDCHTQNFKPPIEVKYNKLNIIEGSYSCHDAFSAFYDYKIFMTVNSAEQKNRIKQRNGVEMLKAFESKWIPLEERYFTEYRIAQRCNLIIDASNVNIRG